MNSSHFNIYVISWTLDDYDDDESDYVVYEEGWQAEEVTAEMKINLIIQIMLEKSV